MFESGGETKIALQKTLGRLPHGESHFFHRLVSMRDIAEASALEPTDSREQILHSNRVAPSVSSTLIESCRSLVWLVLPLRGIP